MKWGPGGKQLRSALLWLVSLVEKEFSLYTCSCCPKSQLEWLALENNGSRLLHWMIKNPSWLCRIHVTPSPLWYRKHLCNDNCPREGGTHRFVVKIFGSTHLMHVFQILKYQTMPSFLPMFWIHCEAVHSACCGSFFIPCAMLGITCPPTSVKMGSRTCPERGWALVAPKMAVHIPYSRH